MEPTLYYILSTLAAAACLAVKYGFRPPLGSKGYVVLVTICFLILCWQFTLLPTATRCLLLTLKHGPKKIGLYATVRWGLLLHMPSPLSNPPEERKRQTILKSSPPNETPFGGDKVEPLRLVLFQLLNQRVTQR